MLRADTDGTGRDTHEPISENARLRAEIDELRRREAERISALRAIRADVRTLLTPISGYLQVIARCPRLLNGMPITDVINDRVLPAVDEVVHLTDRLAGPPVSPQPGRSRKGNP
jgi:hypothetical protein